MRVFAKIKKMIWLMNRWLPKAGRGGTRLGWGKVRKRPTKKRRTRRH